MRIVSKRAGGAEGSPNLYESAGPTLAEQCGRCGSLLVDTGDEMRCPNCWQAEPGKGHSRPEWLRAYYLANKDVLNRKRRARWPRSMARLRRLERDWLKLAPRTVYLLAL